MATNIPQSVIKAIIYVIAVDNLQLEQGLTPGSFRWQTYHWTQEESDFWTSLREILEPLLEPYINKTTITSEERSLVKSTIKTARDYASFDVQGHRLMLKIAAFGDNHDWEVAHIKFGTPLAKKPGKGGGTVVNEIPNVSLIKNEEGQTTLGVVNPATPETKAKPAGIKFVRMYCHIGETAPTKFSEFNEVGNANRGQFIYKYSEPELSSSVKLYAWFCALYENNKGVKGKTSNIVKALVIPLTA